MQATGTKGESDTEQPSKRPKVGIAADASKATTPRSSDSVPVVTSTHAETLTDKNKGENTVSHSPKMNTTAVLQDSTSLKQQPVRPFAPVGSPFLVNRYKLDNRPTAFRILPPLPVGFANVRFSIPLPGAQKILIFLWSSYLVFSITFIIKLFRFVCHYLI